jgi:uncharacterized protein
MVASHGRFIWYELTTTDVERAKAFYAAVVGWGTQDVPMPGASYTLFTAGGTSVSGVMSLPEGASRIGFRPGWLGYVCVDDVDAAAARIKALGGEVHVPPRDIPNVSRVSVAIDPQRVTFALFKWLPDPATSEPPPLPELDALGRVGWHELIAADWEKVWPFYGALFGWQREMTDIGDVGSYQVFSAGGQTIGGMFTKSAAVPVPFWLFYFNVADIDVALRRVKAHGGQVVDGPIEVPNNRWVAQCTDPQGAIFALAGKLSHNGIGYFEPAKTDATSDPRNPIRKRYRL